LKLGTSKHVFRRPAGLAFAVAAVMTTGGSLHASAAVTPARYGAQASSRRALTTKFTLDNVGIAITSKFLPQGSFDVAARGATVQSAAADSYNPLRSFSVTAIPFGTTNLFESHWTASQANVAAIRKDASPKFTNGTVIKKLKLAVDGRSLIGNAEWGTGTDGIASELQAVWVTAYSASACG
jgi:hypothetical protein